MKVFGAEEVTAALPMPAAIAALRTALCDGLDPEAGQPRSVVPTATGHLLLMPAEWGGYVGVKVASVSDRSQPRIQGSYLLLDAHTLTPLSTMDGVALTAVRTAAVSAVAADVLATRDASRLLVFGAGPQAHQHVAALRAIRPVREVIVVGRTTARSEALVSQCIAAGLTARTGAPEEVADADLIACCTTARTPLFDGALLKPSATVVAVGSHEPSAAELDHATMSRSTVVVEARSAALREAGDVIQAVDAHVLDPDSLIDLATLVRDGAEPTGPRVFKSVGMAWEDLVLAASVHEHT